MQPVFSNTDVSGLEIAITGMAGRFPGASDTDRFWANIRDGVESVKRYSDAQMQARGLPQYLLDDPGFVKADVPFEGMDLFDAEFFGFTPREAEQLDPQHRIFLECAWAALENAGYDPLSCQGRVGVFAGSGASIYLMRHLMPRQQLDHGGNIADILGLLSGNLADTLCTRVAYKLNLRGPAVTIQTACSTSLMAVHSACQSLLGYECDTALAGGVSLNLLQDAGYRYQAGAIFSPDGYCRAFDARAAGTLLGSGAGVVVLKRLEDAMRDGDTIHAVIKGSAANNDGADKVGFTAPGISGQASVILAAHAIAGTDAASVSYVEAHGTGTTLGDPIEVAALTQAFRATTDRNQFCALGSVKTNVGHLDAAAGVTGLIKTVLMLQHRILPPSLHFEQPNPQIDFKNSPFSVNTTTRPWLTDTGLLRAGVSAFGIGGTNVHVVLEEAPARASVEITPRWQVLPLSARTAAALDQMKRELAAYLQKTQPQAALPDIAQTLQLGRHVFGCRCAVVADTNTMAAESLLFTGDSPAQPFQVPEIAPEVAFLFPGGGVQHAGMGRALYQTEPLFQAEVDRCCELLRAELPLDLRDVLYPAEGQEAAADELLSRMDYAQPALFVTDYAMARLWIARGVQPSVMLGHSLGEYVAACLAGVFTLEDALRIVAARGRLLHSVTGGAMTTVPLPPQELLPFLHAGCDLAAINGERLCVLSGPVPTIEKAEQLLRKQEISPRRLHISTASHSSMMEAVTGELESVVAAVPRQAPQRAFISCVTGKLITAEQAISPAYWAQHLRSTVQFVDGLNTLLAIPRAILEVGPGDALTALVRQHPDHASAVGIWSSQAHPQQQEHNAQQMALALAGLWRAGVSPDWTICHPRRVSRRVPLPAYPFQRRSFWVEAPSRPAAQQYGIAPVPVDRALYTPLWRDEPVLVADDHGAAVTGAALVVGSDALFVRQLADHLNTQGIQTIRVETANSYTRTAADHFTVRAARRDDYAALLQDLSGSIGSVETIFFLCGTDAHSSEPNHDDVATQRFISLLSLVQALENEASVRRRLMVVTSGAEDVSGRDPLIAENATLFPLCKVIRQECPQIDCRFIDVACTETSEERATLIRQLTEEMWSPRQHPTPIAYRGETRWVKHYVSLQLPQSAMPRLRRRGVYVITGGLGGVGLALAQHLATHWQARLILLGRAGVPGLQHWEALSFSEESAEVRQRLSQLLALEAAGAEVLALSADVTDGVQLQTALRHACQRFGPINGIVHAAGTEQTGMLQTKTLESVSRVFAPKVQGTQWLFEIFGNEPLDFMLLCSSVSSVTGGLGKADYAAANGYLDVVARQESRRRSYPVISVGWDVWRGLGMAAGLDIPEGIGWEGPEGAVVFERLVNAATVPQVIISTTALESRLGEIYEGSLEILMSLATTSTHQMSHPRPPLRTAFVAPSGELPERLAGLWTDVLGISPIGQHDNLFELGGNSLLAIQLLAKVRRAFGVDLHPAAFFKTPTIDGLAELIEIRLIEEIEAVTPDCDASSPVLNLREN